MMRCYKKGTVHLIFKDDELWERFNLAVLKVSEFLVIRVTNLTNNSWAIYLTGSIKKWNRKKKTEVVRELEQGARKGAFAPAKQTDRTR